MARHELEEVLRSSRVASVKRDRILDTYDELWKLVAFHESLAAGHRRKANDLAVHLHDRDAHIANLEAELLPRIIAQDAPQEALL